MSNKSIPTKIIKFFKLKINKLSSDNSTIPISRFNPDEPSRLYHIASTQSMLPSYILTQKEFSNFLIESNKFYIDGKTYLNAKEQATIVNIDTDNGKKKMYKIDAEKAIKKQIKPSKNGFYDKEIITIKKEGTKDYMNIFYDKLPKNIQTILLPKQNTITVSQEKYKPLPNKTVEDWQKIKKNAKLTLAEWKEIEANKQTTIFKPLASNLILQRLESINTNKSPVINNANNGSVSSNIINIKPFKPNNRMVCLEEKNTNLNVKTQGRGKQAVKSKMPMVG